MKANPGGHIDLREVVGRDELIALLWETIDRQSVTMTAERRIGKSTIMWKMEAEAPSKWIAVYQDLEKVHTAEEFAFAVYEKIHDFLSGKGKTMRRVKEFIAAIGGAEIPGGFKLPEKTQAPWKEMLIHAVDDLIRENAGSDTHLLFLWDEVPLMIDGIMREQGAGRAMEVLDVLRYLRQTYPDLRMLITGSIGFHQVLRALKKESYGNVATSGMVNVEVHPLEEPHAISLATKLMAGEAIAPVDIAGTAAAIARHADHFPFYIHHIVRALKFSKGPVTIASVAEVVGKQLVDASDQWQLSHYRTRITKYYGAENEPAVLFLLDELACRDGAASISELFESIKAAISFNNRERLIELLSDLERDHYLIREVSGRYRFRFPLIRRWWILHRDLPCPSPLQLACA